MTSRSLVTVVASGLSVLLFATAAPVSAEPENVQVDEETIGFSAARSQAAGSAGAFLPFSHMASTESARAFVTGVGGYDAARGTGTFEAATEVRLWGPISVRGGAVYTNANQVLRPSFGARVQVLREERHGLAGSFGVFYRPEGLTEPEGEIEAVAAVGRHFGQNFVLANLLYGQDPEGNERDGEVRLAALRPVGSRVLLGLDGRLRFDMGSRAATLAAHGEATLDSMVGPLITAFLGPVAVSLQGGGSTYRLQGETSFGAFAMMGLGTAL